MSVAPDHSRDSKERPFGFWRRSYAMVVKEFIQLRRDRVSFAMIVMIPVMQLLLFGLPSTPRRAICRPRYCCRRTVTSRARS